VSRGAGLCREVSMQCCATGRLRSGAGLYAELATRAASQYCRTLETFPEQSKIGKGKEISDSDGQLESRYNHDCVAVYVYL
jgi:hypothetical protein